MKSKCYLFLLLMIAPPAIQAPAEDRHPASLDQLGDPLPRGAIARLGTTRMRCGYQRGDVAFSPDGKLVASGVIGGVIHVWDSFTGKLRLELKGHADSVYSLAFTPDGKTLVTGGSDELVQLWDLKTGRAVSTLRMNELVHGLDVSANGKLLIAVGLKGKLRLWKLNADRSAELKWQRVSTTHRAKFLPDGKRLVAWGNTTVQLFNTELAVVENRFEVEGEIRSADISSNGRHFAIGNWNGTFSIHNVGSGETVYENVMAHQRVQSVCFSPDGKAVASAEYGGSVRIWDVEQRMERHAFAISSGVEKMIFSPDGKRLAIKTATGGSVRIVEVETGKDVPNLLGHRYSISTIEFSPDGKTLATGSTNDHMFAVWGVPTGKLRYQYTGSTTVIAFSPDSKYVAGGGFGHLHLCDTSNGKAKLLVDREKVSAEGFNRVTVSSAAFLRDGRLVASVTKGRLEKDPRTNRRITKSRAMVWHPQSGESKTVTDRATSLLTVSPDGRYLAGVTSRLESTPAGLKIISTIEVSDAESLELKCKITCPAGGAFDRVYQLAISPHSRALAVAQGTLPVRVYELPSGKPLHKLEAYKRQRIESVAFSREGQTLVAGPGRIHLWDLKSGDMTRVIDASAEHFAISPDDKYIVTGARDGKVRVRDFNTGDLLTTLTGHGGSVTGIKFAPDGKSFASVSSDCTGLIWDVNPELWRAMLAEKQVREAIGPLWEQLAQADAAAAYYAMTKLAARPAEFVKFLRWKNEQHDEANDSELAHSVAVQIELLMSEDEKTCDRAATELSKIGSAARPMLTDFRNKTDSADVRDRVDSLLMELNGPIIRSPADLQTHRAKIVLARIDSAESRALLKQLAERMSSNAPAQADRRPAAENKDLPKFATARIGTTNYWHGHRFSLVALSADGKVMATAGVADDPILRFRGLPERALAIHLWQTRTGRLIHKFQLAEETRLLSLSPDGSRIASLDGDVFRLWDLKAGVQTQRLKDPEFAEVKQIRFTTDGTKFLAFSGGQITQWDAVTGKRTRKTKIADGPVKIGAVSPDTKLLAIGVGGVAIRLLSTESGKQVRTIAHEAMINGVAFSPDGKQLAVSSDGSVKVFDATTGRLIEQIERDRDRLSAVFFASGGKQLGWIESRRRLQIMDRESRSVVLSASMPDGAGFALSGDGELLAAAGTQWGRVWDLRSGESLLERAGVATKGLTFDISPDGKLLITRDGKLVAFRDPRTGRVLHEQIAEGHGVRFSSGGHLFCGATGRFGDSIGVWETATGSEVAKLKTRISSRGTFGFNHDGTKLVRVDSRGNVSLLEITSGQQANSWKLPGSWPDVSLSPDGRTLLSTSSRDDGARFFDVESGKELWKFATRFSFEARAMKFSHDGSKVYTTRRKVQILDARTGRVEKSVDLHEETANLQLSPDLKLFAGSTDELIRVWSVESGQELCCLRSAGAKLSLEFSPDGARLFSKAADRTVLVWDLRQARLEAKPNKPNRVVVQLDREAWPLHRAANMGRLEEVKAILRDGVDVNTPTRQGTALHLAALQGHSDVVKALLAAKADPNSKLHDDDKTPLHQAAAAGSSASVKMLLEAGASVNAADDRGTTPLHEASAAKAVEVVRLLLAKDADASVPRGRDGATPLHLAAQANDAHLIGLLLEAKANVNAEMAGGQTPLIVAAQSGHVGVVERLVEGGADVNFVPIAEKAALETAALAGHGDVVLCLLRNGAKVPADLGKPPLDEKAFENPEAVRDRLLLLGGTERTIGQVVANGDLKRLGSFLDLKPSLIRYRYDGQTLLASAVEKGNKNVAALLLRRGADTEARNAFQLRRQYVGTALHLAVKRGDVEMVKLLLAAGAELMHERPGMEPLSVALAIESGNRDLIDLLVKKSVDLNQPFDGKTPLHAAIDKDSLTIALMLLDKGADPNASGSRWYGSPVHYAASKGRLDILKLLLDRGGRTMFPGPQKITLMQSAAFHGQSKVVQFLQTKMMDVDIHSATALGDTTRIAEILRQDRNAMAARLTDKRTPLHLAAERKQLVAARLLLEKGADVNARDAEAETPLNKTYDREMTAMLEAAGGKKTSARDRLALREEPGGGPGGAVRSGGFLLHHGGEHHIYNDAVYLLIRNVAGRRLAQFEIEDGDIRINAFENAKKGVRIVVTQLRDGKRLKAHLDNWPALKAKNPAAYTAYEKYRVQIEAETLLGSDIIRGGGDAGGHVPWPMVGITAKDLAGGCEVTRVIEGTAAEVADLRVGDIVRKLGGFDVPNFEGFRNLVARHNIGDKVKLELERDTMKVSKSVTLGAR